MPPFSAGKVAVGAADFSAEIIPFFQHKLRTRGSWDAVREMCDQVFKFENNQ